MCSACHNVLVSDCHTEFNAHTGILFVNNVQINYSLGGPLFLPQCPLHCALMSCTKVEDNITLSNNIGILGILGAVHH